MGSKISFGFIFDFRNPPQWERPAVEHYAGIMDAIVETERLGFDAAWIPEHHLAEDSYIPSPLTILAALAARTSRITLGSAIALGPLYDPVRFAEDCAVIDILSGGRLEMGLAIGYRSREYEAFGLDFRKRGQRFDEFLQIVKALWDGEDVTFKGRHFDIRGAQVRPLSPRGQIPLYIGGFAEKALQRVARFGDGYYGNAELWPSVAAKYKDVAKDPDAAGILIPGLYIAVARDPEAAMEELGPHFSYLYNAYAAWMNEDHAIGVKNVVSKPMEFDEFRQSGILQILSPDEAVAHFEDLQGKIPLKHFSMTWPPGLPPERFVAYAADFAEDVIPAFR